MFLENKHYNWKKIDNKTQRAIIAYNDDLMTVMVKMNKGAIGAVHQHIHSQNTYIAKGKFEVQIGSEKQILKIGDSFFINPNIHHGVVCLEDGILIDVFSPKREDFLE